MKDGTTHLAHKAEHAVDLSEGGHGAIIAVNICDAAAGDTATLTDTLTQAAENLRAVIDDERVSDKISEDFVSEAVLDKGYHSRRRCWIWRKHKPAATPASRIARVRIGKDRPMPGARCTRIEDASRASVASGCYAAAARSSNAPSPTATRLAG